MKNFVSGWRRPGSNAGRQSVVADPRPSPEIREPKPAPIKRRQNVLPDADVIDAPTPRARQPITLPTLRIPGGAGQWAMLVVSALLFKVSADATHAALGGWLDYNGALVLQGGLSLIERFHFAGNRNLFTWGAFAADAALTATGLGLVLLPQLFTTPVYAFITGYLLNGFGAEGFTGFSLGVFAVAVGIIVSYGNDKTFDLAMGR